MQRVRDLSPENQEIVAHCARCRHSACLVLKRLPPDLPITELRARLRCAACGSRECEFRLVWHGGIVARRQEYRIEPIPDDAAT